MTDQWCIRDVTTAQIHHVDNARIFGGNDTREMELRPPWGSFGVSGHLHTQRGHLQIANNSASEQDNTAAVALNDAAVWSHLPGPPGAFHSSRHAEFGVELELEGATWT